VGYARFFKAVLEDKLAGAGTDAVDVYHVVGKLFLFGIDLHGLIDDPFFKDHDFNIIVERDTGVVHLIDANLYDYTGIGRVRGRIGATLPGGPM